jgi:hypothetical protein
MSPQGERVVYVGSAQEWFRRQGGEDQAPEDMRLEQAIMDAYEKAPKIPGGEERTFRVVGIFVTGTNPPSDYKVHLIDHP